MELPKCHHVGRIEQRPGTAGTGIAERPDRGPITGRDRHLNRVLDAMTVTDVLDQPDRAFDGPRWVIHQPERQRGKDSVSESVEPSTSGNSDGSMASIR